MVHLAAWSNARRDQRSPRSGLAVIAALVFTMVPAGLPAQQVTQRTGGGDGSRDSLARYVPRRGLVFYLEFDGVNAHAAGWHESAAYKLLVETKLGALLEDLGVQTLDLVQASLPPERRAKGLDLVDVLKRVARGGFVAGLTGRSATGSNAVVVLRGGDDPVFRRLIDSLTAGVSKEGAGDEQKARPAGMAKAARRPRPLFKELVWWVENGELVVAGKSMVDEIMAAVDGKAPSAVDHPVRAALRKADGGFEPVAVGFLDMAALAPLSAEATRLGLDGVERVELRFGFQDRALATLIRVVAPEPRRGLLALLDQPTFGVDSLPPLPADVTSFAVLSLDVAKASNRIEELLRPKPGAGVANVRDGASPTVAARTELLAQLGPKIAFYAQKPDRLDTETVAAMIIDRLAGWTFAAPVRDEAAAAGAMDTLVGMLNQSIKRQLQLLQRRGLIAPVWSIDLRQTAERRGYTLEYVNSQPVVLAKLRPTVAVSRGQLVVAGSPGAVERTLAGGPHWQPAGELVPIVQRLPAGLIYVSLQDPRVFGSIALRALPILVKQINVELASNDRRAGPSPGEPALRLEPEMIPAAEEFDRLLFPSSTAISVDRQGASLIHREAFPSLTSPATTGVLVALCLPAIQSAREAARRTQCVNNLRTIALAMHNYHSTNNAFPRPAITDGKGKLLLSWRVAILPFLDQQALYNRFKLDEPWDSPHNQALLKEMPTTYRCPTRAGGDPSTTTYRVVTGNGALFDKDRDIGVANVTDGTSNTIMVVECEAPVPWTKPEDITFDPAAPPSLLGAGSPHPGGFNVSLADGAVRFISNGVDLKVFRALITRAGGEVINAGGF
jgi:prepilin-type processing-associated H-X9-DG protein